MKEEHLLSCQVAKHLRKRGYITLDCDVMSALRYLPPKDATRRVMYINSHTSMGYTRGQSDLVVLSPKGVTTYIELKNGRANNQSPQQKIFENEVLRRGGRYVVFRTIDDCVNFTSETGE